jgi:hypothetical protein
MRRSLAIALVSLSAAARAAIASAPPEVAVTTCGQIIPDGTLGYLTGNLDCTGFTDSAAPVYGEARWAPRCSSAARASSISAASR